MTQCFAFSYQTSFGFRLRCFTTGLPAYSAHVRPPSVLYATHSPRPVLVYASTSGGFSFVHQPDVFPWSTTADPENAQSPYRRGYRAMPSSSQRTRSRLTAWPQCML